MASHRGPDGRAGLERSFQRGRPSREQGDSPFPSCGSETHPGHKACVPQPGGVRGSQEGKSGYPSTALGLPVHPPAAHPP